LYSFLFRVAAKIIIEEQQEEKDYEKEYCTVVIPVYSVALSAKAIEQQKEYENKE